MAPSSDKDSVSESQAYIKNRQYIRQRVTRLYNKVKDEPLTFDISDMRDGIDRLKEYKTELAQLDKEIFVLIVKEGATEETLGKHHDSCDHYSATCREAIRLLEGSLSASLNLDDARNDSSSRSVSNSSSSYSQAHKLKLPDVPLPVYSKQKDQSLEKFFHNLESIINKHNLTSYEKFIYLRNQLSGAPLTLVNSLDVQEQSYETAKNLLHEAFASSVNVKYEALKNLSELKLSHNGDPYAFAGEMRTIIASFRTLQIDIDTVLQFFIWRALNDRFQSQLVAITNSNKPSLKEIEKNIFSAAERYIAVSERINERNKNFNKYKTIKNDSVQSTNMAINVEGENKFKSNVFCGLCKHDKLSNINHKLKDCPLFNTAEKKVNKLKSVGGCIKCSYKSHSTEQCKYKFPYNCKICNSPHMTFLCLKSVNNSNTSRTQDNSSSVETNNKFSWVEAMQNNSSESIALPTFTCDVIGDTTKTIRVFKDGGCQKNFVTQNLVNCLKLPIIKFSVPLTIHGFNSSKKINTNIVQMKLKIGREFHEIEAICIPSIDTRIIVPGIGKIVSKFVDRGYTLADSFLACSVDKTIDNISLIMGTDGDHTLAMSYKTFGRSYPMSSYIDSPIGVIISGNISRMLSNLNDLPVNSYLSNVESSGHSIDSACTSNSQTHSVPIPSENFSSRREDWSGWVEKEVLVDDVDELDESILSLQAFEEAAVSFLVLDKNGNINNLELERATNEMLNKELNRVMNYDDYNSDPHSSETNNLVSKYILSTLQIDPADGRICCRLPWNNKNMHLLSKNYNLSLQILKSNYRKLSKDSFKMKMYNDVFKEQESLGIIEKIKNIDEFINSNPECSFLPHMGVYRMNNETTKCRVVFLSNLAENVYGIPAVSHNKAMLPGPNLNHKISVALCLLRFDRYLLTFDIRKAFLNIALQEIDQNRLMFLWYNDIERGDYSIVAYRNLRLSFGLRCSPSILMICLYYILIIDTSNDTPDVREIKKSIYHSIYMDNGGYSCNDPDQLKYCYNLLPSIFSKFQFQLQQYTTNNNNLQNMIDESSQEKTNNEVKLLGMIWNRERDTLKTTSFTLNEKAQTKREVLKSLGSVYDVFNIYLPLINRAKLFMRSLQLDNSLEWDDFLADDYLREWRRIAKQVNSTPPIEIPRSMGERGGQFSLHVFTDASKSIYGTVIYLKNVDTGNISFLTARNKLVNNKLSTKTIPSLEMLAIAFGVETVFDIYNNLCGGVTVSPLNISNIELYTDSLVCLHWIKAYVTDYNKMQKRTVFVLNKLRIIDKLCQNFPIKFGFSQGSTNPADFVTRICSHNILLKSNYFQGPSLLKSQLSDQPDDFTVMVPDPRSKAGDEVPVVDEVFDPEITTMEANVEGDFGHLIPPDKYSIFSKTVKVYKYVLQFVNNLKLHAFSNGKLSTLNSYDSSTNFYAIAFNKILRKEQELHFPNELNFLKNPDKGIKNAPDLMNKLNLFIDSDGLIKVKSKFSVSSNPNFPILLPKASAITSAIIRDVHVKFKHMGLYMILKELRPKYWIVHYFSVVKKVVKDCNLCKRLNNRKIRLNQNSYRDERVFPPSIPFSYVYLDFFGPYMVKLRDEKVKIYLLVITCMWTRAINLQICLSLDVHDFIRGIQLHVFQHGMFQLCVSDLGTSIVAGGKIINNFLNDIEVQSYLQENGITTVKFSQYSKGNSSMGSIVENCVKQCKSLMYKSIKNNVLNYFDFQFIVSQTICIINKRPISFQNSLRDNNLEVPQPITPEMLLNGRELISINVIPNLQSHEIESPEWTPADQSPEGIRVKYEKLKRVRRNLLDNYHGEFLQNLINQATDKKLRYTPTSHTALRKGDVVLLVDKHKKPTTYPLGIVQTVEENSIGEVTAARVRKGQTNESVYRHATSLILLIPNYEDVEDKNSETDQGNISEGDWQIEEPSPRIKRKSAKEATARINLLSEEDLI